MKSHKFQIGEYWISKSNASVFHICLTKNIFLMDGNFTNKIQYCEGLHVILSDDWNIIA